MEKNEILENEALTEDNAVIEEAAVMEDNAAVETAEVEAEPAKSTIKVMAERDIDKIATLQRVFKILGTIGVYAFLFAVALTVLFPFYWMLISSVKSLAEYNEAVPTMFPRVIVWKNYADAFSTANLGTLFLNTLYVGVISTILSLVITVLAAFAFARLEFKGKDILFALLLSTMMIPGELFTITNYLTVDAFGWLDPYYMTGNGFVDFFGWTGNFAAMIVPFLVSVFYIFLLRQNFMQIPNELYLAAKVDGTSDIKYLWRVMIPLALPSLISITILKMMGAWNSYVWPRLIAANDRSGSVVRSLVSNGLRQAFTDVASGQTNFPVQLAACTLVSIPLFLVFIFLRKYIMKGVARSGIKG